MKLTIRIIFFAALVIAACGEEYVEGESKTTSGFTVTGDCDPEGLDLSDCLVSGTSSTSGSDTESTSTTTGSTTVVETSATSPSSTSSETGTTTGSVCEDDCQGLCEINAAACAAYCDEDFACSTEYAKYFGAGCVDPAGIFDCACSLGEHPEDYDCCGNSACDPGEELPGKNMCKEDCGKK